MATRRRRESGVIFTKDPYGRELAPALATDRKIRKMRHGVARYRHLAKNGVYDPYTFFHVVDQLLNIQPNREFTSSELTAFLNQNVDHMTWDSTSVGRVLHDLRDNFNDVHPDEESQPISLIRDWSNSYYEVNPSTKARAVLWRLADDLVALCEELADQERQGLAPKRLGSPLTSCPSVMDEAAAIGMREAA